MNRFPASLPPDIVFDILSYIDQRDCVECLRVCRTWYSEIPLYATDLWKRIAISPESWKRTNTCLIRCLGPHVTGVSIRSMNIGSVLSKLKENNCDITQLEIVNRIAPLSQRIQDGSKFLSTIHPFNDVLRRLCITDHFTDLSVPEVLRRFPSLTHLTLLFNHRLHGHLSGPMKVNPGPGNSSHNLVYLHLDAVLHFDDRIIPPLSHCAKLKVLILSNDGIDTVRTPTNLNTIFQLCPRLSHLAWNDYHLPDIDVDPLVKGEWNTVLARTPKSSDGQDGAIRELLFRGDISGVATMSSILAKSSNELERLELAFKAISETPEGNILSHLNFPRLKTLVLESLKMEAREWITFLSGCKDMESLALTMSKEDIHMDTMCEIIGSLQQLRSVKLDRIAEPRSIHREDIWNNITVLSRSRLQNLELNGLSLMDSGLLDLCDIPTLKELSLSIMPDISHISHEGLLTFAGKLKARRSRLATLKLSFFVNLDDTVLERFAQLENLSLLVVICSFQITNAGVKTFVTSPCNTGMKKMDTRHCSSISRPGLWTADMY
ncbi:hypothetical protein BJV82DRAFT_675418 [Fennellomyces sp. T-0311]|nr:hypothetical protein BJV82DRAFT_675418 [Fennellomyces sp. T-0311]